MRSAALFSLFTVLLVGNQALANPINELNTLDARGTTLLSNGKQCTQSTQCKSSFCNRSKCDGKVAVGKACYKDAGCVSGKCGTTKKCVSAGQKIGSKCTESTQCASGYCGHSVCSAKVANGKSCYKNAGCTSGFCVQAKCSKTASHTTPSSDPLKNYADFSSGTLGTWKAEPADKVTMVKDANSPGGYVARMTTGAGGSTFITQTNTAQKRSEKAQEEENSLLEKRQETIYWLRAVFEYRVTKYEALVTPERGPETNDGTGCYANIIINGKNPGPQYIGDGTEFLPKIGEWNYMANGILTNTDKITNLRLGPYCNPNAIMTFDIRNVTHVPEFAYISTPDK